MRVLIGYILWDIKRNRPYSGTRRFKVWSSKSEAGSVGADYMDRYGLEVREAFVEVAVG